MVPGQLQAKIVFDRIGWIHRMVAGIRDLPLDTPDEFVRNPHTPASAESYLRRGLEALLDLGRHILAKGFGRAANEYKAVARELGAVGVLDAAAAERLEQMAGYRNRLVHFYDEVSVQELYEICTEGTVDIERITGTLEQWIRDHPEHIDESL
jgi:uncharacterized protein YutE (UPF0331/DUF86 family)